MGWRASHVDKARKPCNGCTLNLDWTWCQSCWDQSGMDSFLWISRRASLEGCMGAQAMEECMVLNYEEIKAWSLAEDHGARKPWRDVWNTDRASKPGGMLWEECTWNWLDCKVGWMPYAYGRGLLADLSSRCVTTHAYTESCRTHTVWMRHDHAEYSVNDS